MCGTKIYNAYRDMTARCRNKNLKNYAHYGGRGIRVCDEWLGENGFKNFYAWSMANGFGHNLSLDRINVNGNYEPQNCRWVDGSVQGANKRSVGNCEYVGVSLHSSGSCYSAQIRQNGILLFSCTSKSKNECARKRNEYIQEHGLLHPQNVIRDEYEDIRHSKREYLWTAKSKNTGETMTATTRKKLAHMVGLCAPFIGDCISGKRNSKEYEFFKQPLNNMRGYSE